MPLEPGQLTDMSTNLVLKCTNLSSFLQILENESQLTSVLSQGRNTPFYPMNCCLFGILTRRLSQAILTILSLPLAF